MRTPRNRDTRIPRRPLTWLAAALIFTLPPMFGSLAMWVPAFFFATLLAKFWMEPRGYRLRSAVVKLVLAAASLGAVFFSYGSIKGIEPGVSLIVVLMSLKILEAHTARDFHVMVMVAWVLCLCGLFLSQDLSIALCLLVGFVLLLVSLIQFHRGSSAGGFWLPLTAGCKLLAQALPLIVLLFLLFPRVTTGFRLLLTPASSASSGFTDKLSPGSVASLASSADLAFRAEFPDGKIPSPRSLYWRGVVLGQGDGLEWHGSEAPPALRPRPLTPVDGEPIRQWITIEPHGARWMFALDAPVAAPAGSIFAPGDYLWSYQQIRKPRRYEVRSLPRIRDRELQPREYQTLLKVPLWLSPATRELARSWVSSSNEPRAVVKSALDYFRTQGFVYSLSPGEYKAHDLDEFLFQRRRGFCEHYAATFATLMRLAGIPARVVVGYLGGEYNEFGRFFLVRQADTHAWCEVWLPDGGWTRVDPTSVVAPDRAAGGSFLQMPGVADQTNSTSFGRNLGRQPIFTNIRLAWDTLSYAWDTRVLSFDAEAQQSFASEVGLPDSTPSGLLLWTGISAVTLVALYAVWALFQNRARPDRIRDLYVRFCRKAERLGVRRSPSEGPRDFASRAGQLLPNEKDRIGRISDVYIDLQYSPSPSAALLDELAHEVRAFTSASTRT